LLNYYVAGKYRQCVARLTGDLSKLNSLESG
jgi:hypothetical protein